MVGWNSEFSRDHVVHQPMTVYVGLSLLAGKNLGTDADGEFRFPGGRTLLDLVLDAILGSRRCQYLFDYLESLGAPEIFWRRGAATERLWRQMFRSAFFLAALFHDIGYPWQFIHKLQKNLKPRYPGESPLGRDAAWLLKHYGNRLMFWPFFGYRRQAPDEPPYWGREVARLLEHSMNTTHGMPGAVALLHLNDQLRVHPVDERARPPRRFCLEWAAMAVLMHDMADSYELPNGAAAKNDATEKTLHGDPPHHHLRLKLDRDPLSYVLTLVDIMQDFNRFNARFTKKAVAAGAPAAAGHEKSDSEASVSYQRRCERVEMKLEGRELTITYHFARKEDFLLNSRNFLPKLEKRIFDPRQGYLDISGLGLTRVRLRAA